MCLYYAIYSLLVAVVGVVSLSLFFFFFWVDDKKLWVLAVILGTEVQVQNLLKFI